MPHTFPFESKRHLKPFIQSACCDGSCIDFKCFYFSLKGGDIDFLGINTRWSSWKRKADALNMPGTCSHTTIKLVYLRGRLQVDILTFKMPQVRWPPNPPLVMCDISLFSILMASSASDSECRTGYILKYTNTKDIFYEGYNGLFLPSSLKGRSTAFLNTCFLFEEIWSLWSPVYLSVFLSIFLKSRLTVYFLSFSLK